MLSLTAGTRVFRKEDLILAYSSRAVMHQSREALNQKKLKVPSLEAKKNTETQPGSGDTVGKQRQMQRHREETEMNAEQKEETEMNTKTQSGSRDDAEIQSGSIDEHRDVVRKYRRALMLSLLSPFY